jgi:nucleoside-diphosphate-sugar epimerase
MRILVTGSLSYIASSVVPNLYRSFPTALISCCDLKTGQDYGEFKGHHFNVLVHIGALSTIVDSGSKADYMLDVNAFRILKFLRNNTVEKIIFPSTGGAIYGNRTKPAKEHEATWNGCVNPYSQSKYIAEQIIREMVPNHTILRLGNVYGGDMDSRTEALVLTHFAHDNPIVVYGGDQTRDFVHLDVVSQAFINAIKFNVVGTYNIANGESIRLMDLAEQFSEKRGVPIEVRPHRPEEMIDVALDVTAAKKAGLIPRKQKNDYLGVL